MDFENKETVIKKLLILGALAAFVVIGWGIYDSRLEASKVEMANELHEFSNTKITDFKSGKIQGDDLVSQFEGMLKESSAPEVGISAGLEIYQSLHEKKEHELSARVLGAIESSVKDNVSLQLILPRLAVTFEELGNYKKAADYLEKNLTLKNSALEDKTYFDLGRIYLKLGKKDKAKSSLDYVVEKSKDQELIKLAKLFLGRI